MDKIPEFLENIKIKHKFPDHVASRPNFGPSQVRNPSELESDKLYVLHTGGRMKERVVFIRLDDDPRWIICRQTTESKFVCPEMILSLADSGVIPYESGLWNPINWMEKVYS